MKFKTYSGQSLVNATVSIKIDGVRAHKLADGSIVSRAGKPLHNITMDCDVAEIFAGTWAKSVSAVRTHASTQVKSEWVYSLKPLDKRLLIGEYEHLDAEEVSTLFKNAYSAGHEGLVIESEGVYFKVKNVETHDVTVTGIIEGKGKHKGRLGAFMTDKGKVGTGLSDNDRVALFSDASIGMVIEVACMGFTPAGKFMQPRFIRVRYDKF